MKLQVALRFQVHITRTGYIFITLCPNAQTTPQKIKDNETCKITPT
jgi:hypothetical protein